MPWFKKGSYNLIKAKTNNKNSITGKYTKIKEKKPTTTNSKFRSSIKIRFQSYLKKNIIKYALE